MATYDSLFAPLWLLAGAAAAWAALWLLFRPGRRLSAYGGFMVAAGLALLALRRQLVPTGPPEPWYYLPVGIVWALVLGGGLGLISYDWYERRMGRDPLRNPQNHA